ncbi:MAG: tetratricopeptide repeat protein [Alphaproteobacteria bacterium]|nr:tetratricopeptide repeat protein [Alphaproteobacteria bacterium]
MTLLRKPLFLLIAASLLMLTAGCSPQQKEAYYLKRGAAAFDHEDYARARVEFKNAAQAVPTAAEPRYRLGLVDEAEGDLRNAFANFTAAEQQDKNFHPAILKVAQYYMAAEQYDQTQQRINAVLAQAPGDAEAHGLLAALLLREKKYDDAEKEALAALAADAGNVTAVSALTGLYAAQNQFDKAEATIDDGIARHPRNLGLMMVRVMLAERMDDLPKIAAAYEAIFKLKPDEPQFRVDLAAIYAKAGKLDEAEAVLRAGVAALPQDWDMKHRLVLFLGDKRGVEPAENEIHALQQAYPQNNAPSFWLAELYTAHGDSDRAVALLQQIVAHDDAGANGLEARTMLARLNIAEGNRAMAQKLAASVLERDPGNSAALFVRASLAFDTGAYQSAVSDLRSILRDKPDDQDALNLLAETFLRQGHLDLAIDMMKKRADLNPTDFHARVRLAQMLHASGDNRQAMDIVAGVTKAAPDYAPGWESAARIAIESKDWLPAQAAVAALDKLPDQHLTALFLRGQVAQDNGKDEEASALYKEVIDADPASALAEHALAAYVDIAHKLNRMPEATSYIAGLKTDSPYVATILGRCYAATGHIADSTAAFDKAIKAGAPFAEPYLGRAQLYIGDHRPDAAIEVLKKSAAAAPGDFRAPVMEAELLNRAGQDAQAVAVYEDILARDPGFDPAANNMAEIIADNPASDAADLDKARQAVERFAGSANPLLLDTLAWVYARQGKTALAQTVMERALAQARNGAQTLPPQVHYHFGAILMQEGKTEAARAELRQATVAGSSYPGRDEAQRMLAP